MILAPLSTTRLRFPLRPAQLAAAIAAAFALSACGGGGGGGDETAVSDAAGVVEVRVTDAFGAPVPGALVTGPRGTSTTSDAGVAIVLTDAPGASAEVTVELDSFVEQTIVVESTPGAVNDVEVTLDRVTSAAGASLATRSGVLATPDADGRTLSFEVEIVVVDGDSQPVESLDAADFALLPCTPDAANERFDCVRGATDADDVAYAPTAPAPQSLLLVPGQVERPFATALLIDQSGSIGSTDPTGARLYASKVFLQSMQGDDQTLLAAFASGPDARIAGAPLAPFGPFRTAGQADSYFATLDSLAAQVGGNTPLYASVDTVRAQWLSGSATPAGLGKAVVVFTDGVDTDCTSPQDCQARREQTILAAQQDGVRIFSVGLSSAVDLGALGELANGTGGALLYADDVTQLLPLYGSVSRLMSLSLATYRLRWTVRADAAGAFAPGQTLLGRVQVTAAGSRFDVPFVVGVR